MKKIVLFGASKYGELAFDYLSTNHHILFYCDNNPKKWGEELKGIKIISPNELKQLNDKFEIIISSTYKKEIEEQLVNDLGILNYRFFQIGLDTNTTGKGYLNCDWVIEQSKINSESVELFLEKQGNKVGRTKRIVDHIVDFMDIENITSICEIGPGAGIFTRRMFNSCPKLSKYIIYEIDSAWASWLECNFQTVRRPADGISLKYEEDKSISLVHTHAVFVYLNPIDIFNYFNEMLRITKSGGYIVFDFLPSEGLKSDVIEKWCTSGYRFPIFIPEKAVKDFFARKGAVLINEFQAEYASDYVKYLIYRVE